MVDSRDTKTYISGQIGEHLVAAELGRRGIVASVLSGNMPEVDILCYRDGRSLPIQVKAIRRGEISVNLRRYLDIEVVDEHQQVYGINSELNRDLIFVVVKIGERVGEDEFFIFRQGVVQDIIFCGHTSWLEKVGGRRPRNPDSMHSAYRTDQLTEYRENWALIEAALGGK
ncbi:MAG: hypothetical protein WBO29_05865 [Albidovulum sp.]